MIKVFPMDRYPYLEYIILHDERTLLRLGNLHFLLHIFKTQSRKRLSIEPIEKKYQILLEHSSQSKEPKKSNGV